MEHAKPMFRRCAIFTRKSSEEGLEQNFNSLHAQREACEAFIKSQASEGWRLVKTHYDDGGVSGASMEPRRSSTCSAISAREHDLDGTAHAPPAAGFDRDDSRSPNRNSHALERAGASH